MDTFLAALSSIGTAATLTATGFYLHRRGFVSAQGRHALSRYTQQISVPALFFTKLLACPSSSSPTSSSITDASTCPSVLDYWKDAWLLVLWPLYVVAWGLALGYLLSWMTGLQGMSRRLVLVAIGFSNSVGLPTSLLESLQRNGKIQSGQGQLDPNALLSIYLITYPMLLWGLGSWLLTMPSSPSPQRVEEAGKRNSKEEEACLLTYQSGPEATDEGKKERTGGLYALQAVLSRVCQPPVVGALLGLAVLSIPPVRFALVSPQSPLKFFWEGLQSIAASTVPVSMTVLGVHLSSASATPTRRRDAPHVFGPVVVLGVVLGKLLVMPLIGFLSVESLRYFVWAPAAAAATTSPTNISSLALVMALEFATPTANNVMVMVDIFVRQEDTRIGNEMARLLAWQYAAAPVFLTLSVAGALVVAR
jgi:predicted permease